jgi:hypothetical protein
MAPFSMLRRSPRSRKGSEQQKDEDDVKIEGGTLAQEVDQRESNRTMAGSKDTVDGEIKGRRGFNRDLLHSIRSRLTGKPSSSTPQRGTATEVRTTIQPLHLPSCTTILDVGALIKFDATASCDDLHSLQMEWLAFAVRAGEGVSQAELRLLKSGFGFKSRVPPLVSSPPRTSPRDHGIFPNGPCTNRTTRSGELADIHLDFY